MASPDPSNDACAAPGRAVPAWTSIAVALAYAGVAAGLSLALHPIPVELAENDQYVAALEQLLRGERCYDGFHPTHTMLAGAAVVRLLGCDAFTALRLVAACGGGLTVLASHRLAAELAGARAAWSAVAMVPMCPGLLFLSLQASSDALATGLVTAALWLAVRLWRSGRTVDGLLTGLLLGLAVGTRFSAVGFAPVLLTTLRRGAFVRLAAATGLGLVAGFAPHAIVSALETGSPLHSDNWRNLVLKHGAFDPRLLHEPGYADAWTFLRAHGGEMLRLGLVDLWHQLTNGLGRLLTGSALPVATAALSVVVAIAHVVASLPTRRAWPVSLCGGALLVLVSLTFAPSERVLMPLLPTSAVALGLWVSRGSRTMRRLGIASVGVVLALQVLSLPPRLREFVDLHPFAEIDAARELAARADVVSVAGTYATLPRYVPDTVYLSPGPQGSRTSDAALAHVREQALRVGATAIVVGRRSCARLHAELRGAAFGDDVVVERLDDDVVALRFDLVHEDGTGGRRWIAAFTADPTSWRDGPLTLRVRLDADADADRVAAVAVRLVTAPGKGPIVELPRHDDRTWLFAWPLRLPTGEWTLQAELRLHDGRFLRGPLRSVTVP